MFADTASSPSSNPIAKPRVLTPTPPASPFQMQDHEAIHNQDLLGERGRKRRRSSATNQASQLPSTTLRGRGRRRSSSLHLIPIETSTSQELGELLPKLPTTHRHRSKSPDRRLSHGEGGLKDSRGVREAMAKEKKFMKSSILREEPPSYKKRRSQSPSRSRSTGQEGIAKLRRRQRTRSRSRSHGYGGANEIQDLRNRGINADHDADDDDEVAVED